MTLASLAWGMWGGTVLWMRLDREGAPAPETIYALSAVFALPGLLLGLLTVRARLAWLLFAIVPICANGMLLVVPWIYLRMRG